VHGFANQGRPKCLRQATMSDPSAWVWDLAFVFDLYSKVSLLSFIYRYGFCFYFLIQQYNKYLGGVLKYRPTPYYVCGNYKALFDCPWWKTTKPKWHTWVWHGC
jgi:hypothetical protein